MFTSAVVLGLISSVHCLGMCGPLSWFAVGQTPSERSRWWRVGLYVLGKTIAYGFLGLLVGLAGAQLGLGRWQQEMAVVIGSLMLVYALLRERRFTALLGSRWSLQLFQKLRAGILPLVPNNPTVKAFSVGLINGFLPCGMIYMALFGATASGSALYGSLYMLLFGLGTAPILAATTLLLSSASVLVRKAAPLLPLFIALLGLWLVCKGLGLGIPYVSPSNVELMVMQQPTCR